MQIFLRMNIATFISLGKSDKMLKGNSFECHYERMQKKAYSCSRYQISDIITSIRDYIASRSLSNLKRVLPFIRQITYDIQFKSSHVTGKEVIGIRRSLKYFSYYILWFALQKRYFILRLLRVVRIFCKVQHIYLINHISYLSIYLLHKKFNFAVMLLSDTQRCFLDMLC